MNLKEEPPAKKARISEADHLNGSRGNHAGCSFQEGELANFEFVCVPSNEDESNFFEEGDPFFEIESVDNNPLETVTYAFDPLAKGEPQVQPLAAAEVLKKTGWSGYTLCLHCKEDVRDLDAHLANGECFTAIIKCSNCQRIFCNQTTYLSHFTKYCSIDRITCEWCGIVFKSNLLFTYHWYHIHEDKVPENSDVCKLCTNNWCQMLVGSGKAKCMICSTHYSSYYSLMGHVVNHHLSAKFQIERIIKKRLTCTLCYENFSTTVLLKKHYLNYACSYVKCDDCGAIFKSKCTLKHHKVVCHSNKKYKVVMPDKNHACQLCNSWSK